MISSTLAMTRTARERGYAVPAVNILDDLSLRAVVAAAVAASSPLIIQISVKTVRSIGTDLITTMFRHAAADVPVPVALHLDHCPDRAVISDVVRAGWSSVLFDASDRDLETAERETAEVVAEAHAAGVDVESEIENIIGVEDGVGSDVSLHSYDVATLAAVAERTGADLLAPQLGTAHGEYKAQPVLLPERVRELAALTDRPIVLHGGTGLSAEDFATFISAGVSKINISTGVKVAYMRSAEQHLAEARAKNRWDPPSMFRDISAAVQAAIAVHIEEFGAAGKASP
ncbi:class II fructose-bisphosphate aldolase [Cellulomonas humilata]|uniref:Fructose-bisphosphate aldolase class II n=1 Tax=Cellulomonas humilata TaxID=144055 RepID=A0ABU0EFR3_9CELL|nr:class II fructose-bisphosphate aldolase [Cellulomonas humilata]MDQ0374057.1 fructose-bisphosphate aldolase class II [Cellulomonas humilata]